MKIKEPSAKGDGEVVVHYSILKAAEDHLLREHTLPENCEAIQNLHKLWTLGVNMAVSKREQDK